MGPKLRKLLQISGPALSDPTVAERARETLAALGSNAGDQAIAGLAHLLAARNGLYAFEGALHVLPLGSNGHVAFCSFDPETGELQLTAADLEGWAKALLNNYEFLTGHPLVRDWRLRYGALAPGQRLIPRQPFVLGGAFAVDNLKAVEAVDGMRQRARLATAIRDLPDGTQIQWPLP